MPHRSTSTPVIYCEWRHTSYCWPMHEHTASSRHAIKEFPCSVQFCRFLKMRASIICIFNQTVLNTRVIKSLEVKRAGHAARTGEVRNTATILIWHLAINVSRDSWQCSARRASNLPWVLVKCFEFGISFFYSTISNKVLVTSSLGSPTCLAFNTLFISHKIYIRLWGARWCSG